MFIHNVKLLQNMWTNKKSQKSVWKKILLLFSRYKSLRSEGQTHITEGTGTKNKSGHLKIKTTCSAKDDILDVKRNKILCRLEGCCQSKSLLDLQFLLRWSRNNFSTSVPWLLTQSFTDVWPLDFNVITQLPQTNT